MSQTIKQKEREILFIENANKLHEGRYSYEKVVYLLSHSKVIITCPIHGDHRINPSNHLMGNGCPSCGYNRVSKSLGFTNKDFIIKSKLVHGDRYDYSKSAYDKYGVNVLITCKKHGDFLQLPHLHYNGSNCPKCSTLLSNKGGMYNIDVNTDLAIIYIVKFKSKINNYHFIKVGVTSRNVYDRFNMSIYKDYDYVILREIKLLAINALDIEYYLLDYYSHYKYHINDSKFKGSTELFNISCERELLFKFDKLIESAAM